MSHLNALSADAIAALAAEFAAAPEVEGAILLGSYARGVAQAHSDVDFERYVAHMPGTTEERYTLHLRMERLISVTTTTITAKYAEMEQPEVAIFVVPGLRQARILLDRTGAVDALLAAARAFDWKQVRRAARHYASEMVMGLAEETQKLLNGLSASDDYMLSNATHGLLRGATRAAAVSRELLIASENEYDAAVERGMGMNSAWTRYHRLVAGLDRLPDRARESPAATRALAALGLYEETAARLDGMLRAEHRAVIDYTRAAIRRVRSAYDAL